MAYVDWSMKGPSLNTCNCDWGCPCQFNSLPTHGHCRGISAMRIDEGRFGDIDLAGVKFCGLFAWPKAIHMGDGEAFTVVDDGATEEQRSALFTILKGEETEPGATIFNVMAATFTTFHLPEVRPIAFEFDLAKRTGRISIDGIIDASTEPIRNPVTNEEQEVSVRMPGGFEYLEAQYASGTVKAGGPVPQEWSQSHAHMMIMHLTPTGPLS